MTNKKGLEKLEQQLAESRLRLETVLLLSPVGISITRLSDGAIIECNDALLAIIGHQRADVIGRSSAELKLWVDPAQRARLFSQIAAGQIVRETLIGIRRKDGDLRQGYMSAAMLQLDGEAHLVGHLRDATD